MKKFSGSYLDSGSFSDFESEEDSRKISRRKKVTSNKNTETDEDKKKLLNQEIQQELEEEYHYKEEEKWLENLKEFLLQNIIPYTTEDKELWPILVSEEAMKIWKVAFTHESYNPNKGENYEELEKLGDKVLGLNFLLYLMDKYPEFSRKELSEIPNYYLSKKELSKISYKLRLSTMARTNIRGINLDEDLFESLFGALFTIGDKLIIEGAGNLLCKRLLYSIYSEIYLDIDVARGKPKTQINEIFQKAGWGKLDTEWDEETGTFIILFSDKALEDLKELGFFFSSNILAKVTNKNTKSSAEEEAFKIAVDKLADIGITKENITTILKKNKFNHEEFKTYLPRLNAKLKKLGITSAHFSKVSAKKGNNYIVQLIGIDSKTDKKIILATGTSDSIQNARKDALEKFLNE